MFKTVSGIIMMNMEKGNEFDQLGVSEGIRRYGSKAIAAVVAEYEQLRDMDTVLPIKAGVLSYMQKKLDLITLVKKTMRKNQSESLRQWAQTKALY